MIILFLISALASGHNRKEQLAELIRQQRIANRRRQWLNEGKDPDKEEKEARRKHAFRHTKSPRTSFRKNRTSRFAHKNP
jgi:hypothetical protein